MAQTTLTATFSEDVDQNGVEYPGDGGDAVGNHADSRVFRGNIRFDPSSISGSDSITLVELIINIQSVNNIATESWYVGPYNSNGQGNPETDSAANAYSRSNVAAVNYGTYTDFRTTGVKTITLGGSVTTHLEAAIDAASVFSLGLRQVNETDAGVNARFNFTEYIDGTNPPKLRVTHAAASASLNPIHATQSRRASLSLIAH